MLYNDKAFVTCTHAYTRRIPMLFNEALKSTEQKLSPTFFQLVIYPFGHMNTNEMNLGLQMIDHWRVQENIFRRRIKLSIIIYHYDIVS